MIENAGLMGPGGRGGEVCGVDELRRPQRQMSELMGRYGD